MPAYARTHPHQNTVIGVLNLGHSADSHLQDQARQIVGEQHIAATTQDMKGTVLLTVPRQGFLDLIL